MKNDMLDKEVKRFERLVELMANLDVSEMNVVFNRQDAIDMLIILHATQELEKEVSGEDD